MLHKSKVYSHTNPSPSPTGSSAYRTQKWRISCPCYNVSSWFCGVKDVSGWGTCGPDAASLAMTATVSCLSALSFTMGLGRAIDDGMGGGWLHGCMSPEYML